MPGAGISSIVAASVREGGEEGTVEDEAVLDGYSDALYPEIKEMLDETMSNG